MTNGIIRRIDDLGRIVIPKEIRKYLYIQEGDPMEVQYNRNGEIIIRKYKKSFEQCAEEWYNEHINLMDECEFIHRGDYTFCIAPAIRYHSQHSHGGHAKRYSDDKYNTTVARVAAFANALGKNLNEMIGYED